MAWNSLENSSPALYIWKISSQSKVFPLLDCNSRIQLVFNHNPDREMKSVVLLAISSSILIAVLWLECSLYSAGHWHLLWSKRNLEETCMRCSWVWGCFIGEKKGRKKPKTSLVPLLSTFSRPLLFWVINSAFYQWWKQGLFCTMLEQYRVTQQKEELWWSITSAIHLLPKVLTQHIIPVHWYSGQSYSKFTWELPLKDITVNTWLFYKELDKSPVCHLFLLRGGLNASWFFGDLKLKWFYWIHVCIRARVWLI